MRDAPRVVLDTNVWISRSISPNGTIGRAGLVALRTSNLLLSDVLYGEICEVFARPKIRRLVPEAEARSVLEILRHIAIWIPLTSNVTCCRDPSDNHLLCLCLDGKADLLITGDADLLVLGKFEGTRIITAAEFLREMT
jgi:putative PIN family toxin of toxin-antitoxin system